MYCVGGDRVGQCTVCTVWVVTGWDSVLCGW